MSSKFLYSSALSLVVLTGCAQHQKQEPGQLTSTQNPQVAMYTVIPRSNGSVFVEFGTDTNYGLKTWSQLPSVAGSAVSILVAGMRANTVYHLRGNIVFSDGSTFQDVDKTFATGSLPPEQLPKVSATTTTGMTPQPGVELVNALTEATQAFATDLSGSLIWSYQFRGSPADSIQPIKLLPNGHFLAVITPGSSLSAVPVPAGTIDVVREIDLAGNTIREISIDQLNNRLVAAGFDLSVKAFHHDVVPLANGHWIALTNTFRQFTDLPGFPGTINVMGDVIVDLDMNLNPVWVWNEFDHLDVNRHPYQFPDWTHTNALLYSCADGNLIVSMRHQNWLVKVDYKDGLGTGDILWHLGYQGDFTLRGGIDPTDWFYAQHGPSFATTNTTGKFSLALFDNGDDRVFPSGVTCQPPAQPSCPYSTVPILDIDEAARTATLVFHYPAPEYSLFGGNAEVLENGNQEFDETDTGLASGVYEVTQTNNSQVVWHMHLAGQNAYRAFRLPSLYPGVQW